jgi:(p)ppGpp synthase/HD superfamily hydrolase
MPDNTPDIKEAGQILEKAIDLAVRAHSGQIDKAGQPYILHPLRVMLKLKGLEEQIVAVLHDVLEDCAADFQNEVRTLLSEDLLAALLAITKQADEHGDDGYARFIARAAQNRIGRKVKMADLEDNLNVMRLAQLETKDIVRLNRYLRSFTTLSVKS